jgi:hypothetical protein
MINDLIDCIDALVKKTGCDWSLVGQELARLQSDIMVHKSTLSEVQVPERWALMARECQTHVSDVSQHLVVVTYLTRDSVAKASRFLSQCLFECLIMPNIKLCERRCLPKNRSALGEHVHKVRLRDMHAPRFPFN